VSSRAVGWPEMWGQQRGPFLFRISGNIEKKENNPKFLEKYCRV
jgi:hypothetical protein